MGTYSKLKDGNEGGNHEMTSLLSGVKEHGVKNNGYKEDTGAQLTKYKHGMVQLCLLCILCQGSEETLSNLWKLW